MAVSQYFRNEHTSLETGGRAKLRKRECLDCGADIPTAGGKKRCSVCSDRKHEERVCARRERERKAKLAAARPANHSWGPRTPFAQKTERHCLKCPCVKATFHETDSHGREHHRTEWYIGLDQLQRRPACIAVSVDGRAVA